MRKQILCYAIVCLAAANLNAFTIHADGYSLQEYATYSSSSAGRMEFDSNGNLYVSHYAGGTIKKINSAREVNTLVSGLTGPADITWAGGTSYGNYLYVPNHSGSPLNDKILRISPSGGKNEFASMIVPNQVPEAIALDRTGSYGGFLYASTSAQDRIYKISTTGNVSIFIDWPGWTSGGGTYGLTFDTIGKYNGKMYAATAFGSENAGISGLFMIDTNGSVSRFCNSLASSLIVKVDPYGTYFDNDMFVIGTSTSGQSGLWRISTGGIAEQFMTGVNSFAFGNDGAMYVSFCDYGQQELSIARVIPEPATLVILAAGALLALRKKY